MPMIIVTSKISKVNIRAMFCYQGKQTWLYFLLWSGYRDPKLGLNIRQNSKTLHVLYSNLVWDLYSLTIIENRAMSVFLGSLVNVAHRPWSVIPQSIKRLGYHRPWSMCHINKATKENRHGSIFYYGQAIAVFLGSLVNVAHRPWSVIPQPLYRNSSVLQIVLAIKVFMSGFGAEISSKPAPRTI
jgi:hypothetical protein